MDALSEFVDVVLDLGGPMMSLLLLLPVVLDEEGDKGADSESERAFIVVVVVLLIVDVAAADADDDGDEEDSLGVLSGGKDVIESRLLLVVATFSLLVGIIDAASEPVPLGTLDDATPALMERWTTSPSLTPSYSFSSLSSAIPFPLSSQRWRSGEGAPASRCC